MDHLLAGPWGFQGWVSFRRSASLIWEVPEELLLGQMLERSCVPVYAYVCRHVSEAHLLVHSLHALTSVWV